MTPGRIAELLAPFDLNPSELQLNQISIYIDLLLQWNARINLTAIRDPEAIVTRHFGESLFAASHLPAAVPPRLVDVGSGAGFPGLPVKLWNPALHVTLIESSHKKAAFLREVIRSLTLTDIDVSPGRAEAFPDSSAGIVALRAVERFDTILPVASRLVAPAGHLALLIGHSQVGQTLSLTPQFSWSAAIPVPLSTSRVLLIGTQAKALRNL